ncbi:MAG: leucine-rich repeat domain-containing protein, partial [Tidjanibacter sp.]|nr:leucine-rich repeat domain-containing protein [Tidjanibacter sp.]
PGSVNTIGNNVFYQCTSLAEVTFEPSATGTPLTMGYDTDGEAENLFQDNNALTTLVLNREIVQTQTGVDTNSEGLFGGMPTLASITLGEQVKTLSDFMFAGSSIEELVIPGNVMTIGNSVFEECEKLATITFEQSSDGKELTIGTNGGFSPFYDSPLTTVNLYREMKYPTAGQTASGLFGGKKDLVNLTIGEQVKTLSPYMFAGSGLTTINLNKVETIKDRALSGLALTSLTIPGGVNTIGDSVFAGCNKLVTITFEPSTDGKALAISSRGGYSPFFDSPLTTLNLNRELKYSIPGQPASGLFGAKKDLANVTLGDQVKTLSPFMFANSGLTSLDLNKVETIQTRALAGLALTSLTIPGFVKSIDNCVFVDCTELKELTFNPNDKGEALKIGFYEGAIDDDGPFYDCPLTTINLNRELDYDFDGATPDDATEGVFGGKSTLASVTLGQQVKALSPFMFANSAITALDFMQVETIGKNALMGADFTELTIPAAMSFIDDNAFLNCDKLTNLTFEANEGKDLTIGFQPGTDECGPFWQSPLTNIVVNRGIAYTDAYNSACDASDEGIFSTEHGSQNATISLGSQVTRIPKCMFATLPITSITIPASVTEIGENAFADCEKLEELTIERSSTPLTVCNQADTDLLSSFYGPFYDSPLKTIYLGREINYVKVSGETFTPAEKGHGFFASKQSVETVNISLSPEVNTISEYMFAGLKIKNFYISKYVTNIAGYAFYDCSELSSLTFEPSTTPLTIGFQKGGDDRGPFYQSPLAFISLHRDLVMDEEYATNCDEWDEGVFSNKYYDNNDLTTQIYLGDNYVTTILPYMFSAVRMEQLHLPSSINKIGKNVVDHCYKLNAIVFYNSEKRPDVLADNAFGDADVLDDNNYFLFMPRWTVSEIDDQSVYYKASSDGGTYWQTLSTVMVDADHIFFPHQPHCNYWQRYYDENGAKPGYEWYKERYFDNKIITIPVDSSLQ